MLRRWLKRPSVSANVNTMNKGERTNRLLDKQTSSAPCGFLKGSLLPSGVVRVCDEAIGAKRLLCDVPAARPVTVAAFDFDGTCISGSSPKKLVSVLSRHKLFGIYKLFRIGCWGLAYKLNLPSDPEGVRERVFSVFKGFPAILVNEFMYRFFCRKIEKIYRSDADAAMLAHIAENHVVVVVSASFEPIIASAMMSHPIQFAIASRMKIDENGNYTDKVEGLPTEGPDKLTVLKDFLNDRFGDGGWRLGWAYGDHYSDLEMLAYAENPCAVTPDKKLRRYAKRRGWAILDWS